MVGLVNKKMTFCKTLSLQNPEQLMGVKTYTFQFIFRKR